MNEEIAVIMESLNEIDNHHIHHGNCPVADSGGEDHCPTCDGIREILSQLHWIKKEMKK